MTLELTDDAKRKAASTYNAASDFYDHPANTFWDRYGRRTVERLRLSPGERVLDVCCGSGASAIPAAEIVRPTGSVVGVDLADNLLALARSKARERGMSNIEFRVGDMTQLPFDDGAFDVVVCVFGIFSLPTWTQHCASSSVCCVPEGNSRSPRGAGVSSNLQQQRSGTLFAT